ncbi:phage tail length tape measure family protein [Methylopila sp. M107]|uniref:phage tail length tape measure family protein n=1 Tax=Methylopila sp. M107 TaxID=1101190 RepID=UPI0018CB80B6|nr:phage tail length tape measure family protein [Methylopila sp. M107]
MTVQAIRELTVRGRADGLDKLRTELSAVKREYLGVETSAEAVGQATDATARKQEAAARAWGRHQAQIDGVARALQRAERDMAQAIRAADMGVISQARAQQEVARTLRNVEAAEAARSAEIARSRPGGWDRMGLSQVNADNPGIARLSANAAAEEKMRNLGRVTTEANKAAGLGAHQWTNLAFQINDAATMALSGASAFQIVATQGGQVFQILQSGPKGVVGSLKEIGVAALGLLSPLNLVIAGMVAVPTALALYSMSGRRDVETLDDAFKRHADTIRSVKDLYGEAAGSLREVAQESEMVVRALAKINLEKLREQAVEQGKVAMRGMGTGTEPEPIYDALGNATGMTQEGAFSVDRSFAAFRNEIDALNRSYREGNPLVEEFRQQISARIDSGIADPLLRERAEQLINLTDSWRESLARLPEAMRAIGVTAESAADSVAKIRTERFGLAMREIWARTPAQRGQVAYDQTMDRLRDDKNYSPDAKAIEADRARRLELDRIRKSSQDAERQAAASHGFDMREIGARTVEQRAAIAADRARASALEDTSRAANADAEAQRASARVIAEAREEARRYADEASEAAHRRLASAEAEASSIGRTATETERARLVMEMTNQARDRAYQLTGSYENVAQSTIDAINREAAALAALGEQTRKVRLEQDLMQEREAIFMGEREAAYRSRIRSAGFDPESEYGRARIEIMRTTDALKEMKEIGASAWSTIGDSIRSGEGVGASIAAGGRKLLDDMSKRAWDNMYDQAWSAVGDAIPALKDLGLGGKPDGSSSTRALWVQMSPASAGATGLLGSGSPDLLKSAANSNFPDGTLLKGPGDIVRSPLASTAGTPTSAPLAALPHAATANVARFDPVFDDRMKAMFADAPGKISVYSGYRSPEYQQGLWNRAVAKYGSPEAARKWVAPPGRSMHGYGEAADLRYENPQTRAWAHENAGRYGLRFPMGHEPWHIEPIGGRRQGGTLTASLAANPTATVGGVPVNQIAPTAQTIDVKATQASLDTLKTSATNSAGGLTTFGQGLGDISNVMGGIGSVLGMALGGKKNGGIGALIGGIGAKLLFSPGGLLGFEGGGWTGHGARTEPAGVVHRGEFVFDARATSRIGVATLDGIRKGLPGYYEGGLVGNDNLRADNDRWSGPGWTAPAPPPPPDASREGSSGAVVRLELDNKLLRVAMVREAKPVARAESARAGARAVEVSRRDAPNQRKHEQRHGHSY